MTTRNQILNALVTQLQNNMPAIKLFSRRYREPDDVSATSQMPILFVLHAKEDYPIRQAIGLPAKREISVEVLIYIGSGMDQSTIPDETVCDILDSLDSALKPPVGSTVQTLGGLVDHCYIEGMVKPIPGDLDGIGMILVPVSIVIP